MLPITTTYRVESDTFYLSHKSFLISLEQAKSIAELIDDAVKNPRVKKFIIDTREAKGVWSQEVIKYWNTVNIDPTSFNKRVVTLTSNYTAECQLNRNAKLAGMDHLSRAFCSGITDDVIAFLNQ